jgi:hypothetical protein
MVREIVLFLYITPCAAQWQRAITQSFQATAAAAAFAIAAAAFAGRALLKGFSSIRGSLSKGVQGRARSLSLQPRALSSLMLPQDLNRP